MPITELAPCPYCPAGGDVSMACTDLETKAEYQAWCRTCWAHGPSRILETKAAEAWNEASTTMRGMELTPGRVYVLDRGRDGLMAGRRVVFRWRSEDGKFNIFNPEGEADIKSALSIRTTETVRYIRESEQDKCEACNGSGTDHSSAKMPVCEECGGSGRKKISTPPAKGQLVRSFPVDESAGRCGECDAKLRRVDDITVLCPVCVEEVP